MNWKIFVSPSVKFHVKYNVKQCSIFNTIIIDILSNILDRSQ